MTGREGQTWELSATFVLQPIAWPVTPVCRSRTAGHGHHPGSLCSTAGTNQPLLAACPNYLTDVGVIYSLLAFKNTTLVGAAGAVLPENLIEIKFLRAFSLCRLFGLPVTSHSKCSSSLVLKQSSVFSVLCVFMVTFMAFQNLY